MPIERRSEDNETRRYLRMAAELRLAIEHNLLDFEFEKRPGARIVYIFDANVIQLFLNPKEQADRLLRFGGGRSRDNTATAMVTTEFLFSRHLSAQNDTPAYLSEGHAEDVANIVKKISQNIEEIDLNRVPTPDEAERLALIVRRARSSSSDPRDAAKKLSAILPEFASTIFDGPLYEARQLARLLEEDLIRPLRLLPEATGEIVEPDVMQVQIWFDLIEAERPSPSGKDVTREQKWVHNQHLRRDAETIVQLIALNASSTALEARKYVLVTTDGALRRAYSKWFYAGGGEFADFALRHPSQYVPILNSQQMENQIDSSELIEHVRDVIDSLFRPLQEDGGDYMLTLAAIAFPEVIGGDSEVSDALSDFDRAMLEALANAEDLPRIQALERRWEEAMQGILLLNAPVMKRHFERGWQDLLRILKDVDNLGDRVLTHVDEVLRKVEATHAGFVLDGFMKLNRTHHENDSPEHSRLLVRSRDEATSALVTALTMNEIKAAFRAQGDVKSRAFNPMLFSAVAAFKMQQWNTVGQFCKRADQSLRYQVNRPQRGHSADIVFLQYELAYLDACSAKFRLDEEEYHRAHGLLENSIHFYGHAKDTVGMARSRAELVSLKIAFLCWSIRKSRSGEASHTVSSRSFELVDEICSQMEQIEATKMSPNRFVDDIRRNLLTDLLKFLAIRSRFFRMQRHVDEERRVLDELSINIEELKLRDRPFAASLYDFCMLSQAEGRGGRRAFLDFKRSFAAAIGQTSGLDRWLLFELKSRVERSYPA